MARERENGATGEGWAAGRHESGPRRAEPPQEACLLEEDVLGVRRQAPGSAQPFQDGAQAPRQGCHQEVSEEEPIPLLIPRSTRPHHRRQDRGAQGPRHQKPHPLP